MQTKTYFASSVPAALEAARKELGPEAMLVNSRPAPAEAREFGRLEVTFAFDPRPATPFESRDREVSPPTTRPARSEPARSEMDEIRQQLAALREAVGQTGRVPDGPPAFIEYLKAAGAAVGSDDISPAISRLCAAGLCPDLARDIAAAASRISGERHAALIQELTGRIPIAPFGEMKAGETRTLAFVGPAGRGKTTSLVKIAVRYGLAKRVPVRIYSAGSHGIGGQEQMARYAAILGVPFQAMESLESLHLALNGESWKGLILIDTPGVSRSESAEISALAGFFSRRPEIEKHLVLRADARTADMLHAVSGFASLSPSRILFTGLDEALSFGTMIEVSMRTKIPAAFAGTGQQIPEDLDEASAEKWARTLISGNLRAAAAA